MSTESYKIEALISDPYEFEIFITDIFCLHLSDIYNLEYETIFVTSSGNDKGIDAIVIFKDLYNYIGNQYYFLQISKGSKNESELFDNFENNVKEQYEHIIGEDWYVHKKVCITIGSEPRYKSEEIDYISGDKLRGLVDSVARRYELIDEDNNINEVYKKNIEIRKKVCKHMNKYSDKDSEFNLLKLYNEYILYNFKSIKDKKFGTIELIETLINSRIDAISGILDEDFSTEKLQLLGDIYINNKKMKKRKQEMYNLVDFTLDIKKYIKSERGIDLEAYATQNYIGLKQNGRVVAYFSYYLSNNFAFPCEFDKLDSEIQSYNKIIPFRNLKSSIYKDNKRYKKDTNLVEPDLDSDKEIIKELVIASLDEH